MKRQKEFDQNIVNALKKLEIPLTNSNGKEIIFDKRKRNETIYEHIANKEHQLKIRDIEKIPAILKDKSSVHKDKKSNKFKTYYGKRPGRKLKKPYLKIITKIVKDEPESIITIYTVRRKD